MTAIEIKFSKLLYQYLGVLRFNPYFRNLDIN